MGNWFSSIWAKLIYKSNPFRILMVGLDNAGKTTILYSLKLGEVIKTLPTIGFRVEQLEYKTISFVVWDVGGQEKIRPLWRHYYINTQAIIFVVDCVDLNRIKEVEYELYSMLQHPDLNKCYTVLIFANKQDMMGSVDANQLVELLHLNKTTDTGTNNSNEGVGGPGIGENRHWKVQSCCALTGDGIFEGLDWLVDALTNKSNNG